MQIDKFSSETGVDGLDVCDRLNFGERKTTRGPRRRIHEKGYYLT